MENLRAPGTSLWAITDTVIELPCDAAVLRRREFRNFLHKGAIVAPEQVRGDVCITPEVGNRGKEGIQFFTASATGSPLLGGFHPLHPVCT